MHGLPEWASAGFCGWHGTVVLYNVPSRHLRFCRVLRVRILSRRAIPVLHRELVVHELSGGESVKRPGCHIGVNVFVVPRRHVLPCGVGLVHPVSCRVLFDHVERHVVFCVHCVPRRTDVLGWLY